MTQIGTVQGVVQHHAIVLFCEMAQGKSFAPFKTQNFEAAGQSWLVAEADPVSRTVISVFDAQHRPQPLIDALCAHFRCDRSRLAALLGEFTFAVKVEQEYFIRSVASHGPESITFFCHPELSDRLPTLESKDLLQGPGGFPLLGKSWASLSTRPCPPWCFLTVRAGPWRISP